MTDFPPSFCPYCGAELRGEEPAYRCPDCGSGVYHSPAIGAVEGEVRTAFPSAAEASTVIAVEADYCPLCGAAVEHRDIDGRERAYCPDCERVLWRNAVPGASVAVVDGDRVCCIRRGQPPAEGAWALPGGHAEYDEPLPEAGARELEEETGLRVDADALEAAGTRLATGPERNHAVVFFVVDRWETTGNLDAGTDAAEAAFLTVEAYATRETVHDQSVLETAIGQF